MKEKARSIAKRLTGFSSPLFGLSWNATNTDRDMAGRVIAFLEDRRVLYNPSHLEDPSHCVASVLEIRRFLTEQLGRSSGQDLQESLRALRLQCRKFLELVGVDGDQPHSDPEIVRHGAQRGHWASWHFNAAVGELRGVFGIHLAGLAARYKIDVEKDLASIFPLPADKDAG